MGDGEVGRSWAGPKIGGCSDGNEIPARASHEVGGSHRQESPVESWRMELHTSETTMSAIRSMMVDPCGTSAGTGRRPQTRAGDDEVASTSKISNAAARSLGRSPSAKGKLALRMPSASSSWAWSSRPWAHVQLKPHQSSAYVTLIAL
jgi:hypothetical protein